MYSKTAPILRRFSSVILELVFPTECLGCEEPGALLCNDCKNLCLPAPALSCPGCGHASMLGGTHPRCREKQLIDGIFSTTNYQDKLVRSVVRKFKYRNVRALAEIMADVMSERVKPLFHQLIYVHRPTILFVPLHPRKEHNRGFNQSRLLALELSERLNLDCKDLLAQIKESDDQTTLNKKERQANVSGKYGLKKEFSGAVKNQNFFIVDDVCTTGATVKECARVLKRNGANLAWGITFAKE